MAEDLLKGGKRRKGTIGSFPVPSDFSPEGKRFAQFVNDSLQQLRGEKGNKLDSAVTFGDLINSGLAEKSNIQIAGGGSTISAAGGGVVNILKSVSEEGIDFPTAPSGVSADGAFKNIIIDWDYPTYRGHSHTEVFVADANSFASVEITKGRLSPKFLGQTTATVFNHAVGNNQTKFYWVRHINKNGVAGPVHSTTGVTATTVGIATADFQDLAVTNAKIANLAVDEAKIANLAVTGAKIANATIDSAKIGNGEITNAKLGTASVTAAKIANATITDAKITGTLNANKIAANSLNISSKGVLGSAGNIKSGSGQIQQTTNSVGAVNQFFGGSSSLLTTFAASSPFHKFGSTSLGQIAAVSFSTPSNTATYNMVGFFGETGTFGGDEEKLIVISIQNTSGTVIADRFQYVNFAQATDIFSIALTQSLSGNSSFVARLYAGTKNVDTNGGVLRITGTIMVFGLGL